MSWTGAALFQQDLYSLWLKRWRPHKRYTRPIYISSSIGSKTIWREIFSFILFNLHANLLSKLTFFFFFFEYIYIYRRDFPWTAVLFRWEIIITYYTYIERGKRIIYIRHPHKPLWMMRRNSYTQGWKSEEKHLNIISIPKHYRRKHLYINLHKRGRRRADHIWYYIYAAGTI